VPIPAYRCTKNRLDTPLLLARWQRDDLAQGAFGQNTRRQGITKGRDGILDGGRQLQKAQNLAHPGRRKPPLGGWVTRTSVVPAGESLLPLSGEADGVPVLREVAAFPLGTGFAGGGQPEIGAEGSAYCLARGASADSNRGGAG
jgi:hypothetical protein